METLSVLYLVLCSAQDNDNIPSHTIFDVSIRAAWARPREETNLRVSDPYRAACARPVGEGGSSLKTRREYKEIPETVLWELFRVLHKNITKLEGKSDLPLTP